MNKFEGKCGVCKKQMDMDIRKAIYATKGKMFCCSDNCKKVADRHEFLVNQTMATGIPFLRVVK